MYKLFEGRPFICLFTKLNVGIEMIIVKLDLDKSENTYPCPNHNQKES